MALVQQVVPSPASPHPTTGPICGVFKALDTSTFKFELRYQPGPVWFIIGRDLGCDQPLLGKAFISRLHCKVRTMISPDAQEYLVYLKDCSKNGSYVNGARLPPNELVEISSGSKIAFGAADGLQFEFIKYSPSSLQAQYAVGREELGRGAFGTVIKAINRSSGDPVAIKVLKLEGRRLTLQEEHRKRTIIKREVDLLSRIRHPNIVKMEAAMVENNNVYVVMEFASYGNLGSLIRKVHALNEHDAKIVTQQLCVALLWLHGANIIHRDIKPANILIYSFNPPVIKVADFGLARVHDAHSPFQTMCGTPAYMAPEVCAVNLDSRRYDYKVDSWSVGVTILHMLSGRVPFSERDIQMDRGIDNRSVKLQDLPLTWSIESRHLIAGLCVRNPRIRMSMSEATQHNWLREIEV